MANYKVKGTKIIANVSALTEEELNAVKNYLALGYTLQEKKVTKTKKIADMREELAKDPATLEKFEAAYKEKAEKGNKDFKNTGFAKACKIYNDWVKKNKK